MTLLKKIQMEKITSKNTNRALPDTNPDKTTVLLSHLRNTMLFQGSHTYSKIIFHTFSILN